MYILLYYVRVIIKVTISYKLCRCFCYKLPKMLSVINNNITELAEMMRMLLLLLMSVPQWARGPMLS